MAIIIFTSAKSRWDKEKKKAVNVTGAYVYDTCKIRCGNEQLFKMLCGASSMMGDAGFVAWPFFGKVAEMAACLILDKLRSLGLPESWPLGELLGNLSRVHCVQGAGNWRMAQATKKTRELIENLGFSLDHYIVSLPD